MSTRLSTDGELEVKPMLKRILTFIIALILTLLPMSSCFAGEQAVQTQPDSTAEETDEVVLHSFYATRSMHVAYPNEGEDEKSSWFGIYLPDKLVNGELRPNINEGETVEIIYEGEITPHETESYGVIQNLHSITLVNDLRTYGGIDYGVAVMQPMSFGYDKIAAAEANVSVGESEFPMFLAQSASELAKYADTYFFAEPVFSGNYTEEQIENAMRWNDRHLLLSDYNDEFFAKNDLIMLFIESGSGSARYDVTDIVSQDRVLTIDITMTKGYLTCDMSNWIYFISVPKNVTALTSKYQNTFTVPEGMY